MERLDPQERAYPCKKFFPIDWFNQEIIGSGINAQNSFVSHGGHHNDRKKGGFPILADDSTNLVAAHIRQQDVKQDQVRLVRFDFSESFLPGPCGDRRVTVPSKDVIQNGSVVRRVVDDENGDLILHERCTMDLRVYKAETIGGFTRRVSRCEPPWG